MSPTKPPTAEQGHEDVSVTASGEVDSPRDRPGLGARLRHLVRLRDRTWKSWTAFAVVVALVLGAAGVLAAATLFARTEPTFTPIPPKIALGPLSFDAPIPSESGVTDKLEKPAGVPQLGKLTGEVFDANTGQRLWSRDPDKPMAPGSTNKILTMAAVLLAMDPGSHLTTKVVAGPSPDSVVLVGGGDPSLSSLPDGSDSVYAGAAKLANLAQMVKVAHPGPIRSVLVDTSLFAGEGMAPGWDEVDIQDGNFTPIGSLILDGGRSKPAERDPPRTATPATDAGKKLAQLLGADTSTIAQTTVVPNAAELGRVTSPSISDLVENTLRISDNVLAEALARHVAIAKGEEPSFAGAAKAVRDVLSEEGFTVTGADLVDGSGLSTEDKIPASLLGQVMRAAAGPESDQRAGRLRPLLAGLPVAGGDGTLQTRFDDDASSEGKGWVRAKTGTLTGVSALAGTVVDDDGRLLTFAFMSGGTSPADSRPKLDVLASTLRACGCR